MSRAYIALVLIAAAFGVARFIVPVTGGIEQAGIFKDLAHCFVGGLFGAAICATARTAPPYPRQVDLLLSLIVEWRLWSLAWGLTALEVVAFLVRRN